MRYMLDTDICVTLIRRKSPNLYDKVRSIGIGELGLSIITVAELQYGVQKGLHQEQNQQALLAFFSPFEIVDFNSDAAIAYGRIRADLEKMGERIGPYDLMIAAQAKTLGVVLVTGNVREFSRVDGLVAGNWLK